MSKDAEATSGWTAGRVRLFAGVLVAFQVAQGLADPIPLGNKRFTQSYYLVTYGHGFIRRGLLGEMLHLVLGLPTLSDVDLVADLVVGMSVIAVVVVIELLIRHGTSGSWAMALLVAASPFTIDYFLSDRRPDLLALVLLVVLGLVLHRGRRALAWSAAVGVGFAVLVLVHEDVILIEVPWALLLVLMNSDQRHAIESEPAPGVRKPWMRLVAVAGPPMMATAVVLTFGLPSTRQVEALQGDVSGLHLTGNTVFTYLPNSIHTSIDQVGAIPTSAMVRTLVLGAVLIGLQLAWVFRWVRPRLGQVVDASGHRIVGLGLGAVVVATTTVLFATGFDWVRWFADCGASWLIVQAFAALSADSRGDDGQALALGRTGSHGPTTQEPHAPAPEGVPLSRWLPALAVYLVAVPPLDVLFVTHQLRHFLLFV